MATTHRWKVERWFALTPRGGVLLLGLAASAGLSAQTPTPTVDFGVSSQLIWTSNSSLGESNGESDTSLQLRPSMRLRNDGGRVKLNGFASVSLIDYVSGTQPRRVDPSADLQGRAELVERFLFVEAGYRATQINASAFGARPDAGATANTLTTSQWRVSPVIEGRLSADARLQLRSDNTWTRQIGDTIADGNADGFFGHHVVLVEHDPRPFGWRLEADRSVTRYDDPLVDAIVVDIARGTVNYAVTEGWSLGVRAGSERDSQQIGDSRRTTIYGLQTSWQPTPRTTFSAFSENRSFGKAWNLVFTHRRPQLAWNIELDRRLSTAPQSVFELPPSENITALLDAMLTTRIPDARERARVVQEFITSQGLPTSTTAPIGLFVQRLSIVTSRRASLSLTGARSSLSFNVFSAQTQDALASGPLASGEPGTNNRQIGASVILSHRLTPFAAVSLTTDWNRIRAIDSGDRSSEKAVRMQLTMQVAVRTHAVLGGRYRRLASNVATDGKDSTVFLGLDHRF